MKQLGNGDSGNKPPADPNQEQPENKELVSSEIDKEPPTEPQCLENRGRGTSKFDDKPPAEPDHK